MSNVLNPNYNNYPEQTQVNTKNIEYLKQSFKTSLSLTDSDTSVLISTTNITEIGKWIIDRFIYSANALLFKIKAFDSEKLYIEFYSDLSGQNEELTNFEFSTTSESYDYDTQTSEIIGEVEYNATQHGNPIVIPAKITIPEVRFQPNILINGDFNINQRGKSTYTSTGSTYCVDRWQIADNGGTFDVSTKTYTSGTQYYAFQQKIENYANFRGKTLTLSIKVNSISNNNKFGLYYRDTAQHDITINTTGIISYTFTVDPASTQLIVGLRNKDVGESISFDYIKLEIGNIATPFNPRPYAEELAMCRRYFVRLNYPSSGKYVNVGFNGSITSSRISFPMNLRTSPTISYSDVGDFAVNTDGSPKIATAISVGGYAEDNVSLKFDTTGLTPGFGSTLYIQNANAYLEFDSEM